MSNQMNNQMTNQITNQILEHWKNPFHRQKRSKYDLYGSSVSPMCGDEIELFLLVENGVVTDAYFEGVGCVICLGMASLTTQYLVGKTIAATAKITETDIFQLAAGVKIDRRRFGCVLVAYQALKSALIGV